LSLPSYPRAAVREALGLLGVRRLVLGIHDAAFPCDESDDTGRGTPCSPAGRRLLAFAAQLGFDGIQLGPHGEISADNPSPYDSTLFSRSVLSISLARLAAPGSGPAWLSTATLEELVATRPPGPPDRTRHRHALGAHARALAEAARRLASLGEAGDVAARDALGRLREFVRSQRHWLDPDALFEALRREHPGRAWREWPAPDLRLACPDPDEVGLARARREEIERRHRSVIEACRFAQWLASEHHAALRDAARQLGVELYGDLQIGFSERDEWAHQPIFLPGYRMGAPPSRTNPEGQPWGYPVLSPAGLVGADGAARRFLAARLRKMFDEYDGVRIDHPHGWVCPWVYRSDDSDPGRAVRAGARLYASPDLPDHPALAAFAIARPDQLRRDAGVARHADDWVSDLDADQVDRYARGFDLIVSEAASHGRDVDDMACEVLSTLPYPLARVLVRHGFGRFRITQKADPKNHADVYRSANARPADWIMLGNHDTPSIWSLFERWTGDGTLRPRLEDLAERLAPEGPRREAWLRRHAGDPGAFVTAAFADCLASPAGHVMVAFTDLFGFSEPYNRPGLVAEDNWSLRLPTAWRRVYAERLAAGRALSLPRALAVALRSLGDTAADDLATRLEAASVSLPPPG